jgi:hypothetical protein
MFIGSQEHKELFCRTFVATHRPYEPADLPWPELDETSIARLRAIPVWSMALGVEIGAGKMLAGFGKTEADPMVRNAIELQGYEEDRHGRILSYMIAKYGIDATPIDEKEDPTRRAFVHFGYNECVDSFAGFGIFKLACESRILPDSLTSIFVRVLEEEARHIVFFVNWVAWDRSRRGYRGFLAQAIPALASYIGAIIRRVRGGSEMAGGGTPGEQTPLNLFGDVLDSLTPAKFLRACVEENERYMRDFDPRLLRPRVIPTLGAIALSIFDFVDWVSGEFAKKKPQPQQGT